MIEQKNMTNYLLETILFSKRPLRPLVRPPLRLAARAYRLVSKKFQLCRQLLGIFSRILYLYENRSHTLPRENDCLVRIQIAKNSPTLVRDILIFLNTTGVQASLSGKGIDNMIVDIDRDIEFDTLGEVFSCFHLNPLIVDTHICWPNDVHDANLTPVEVVAEKEGVLSRNLQTFINGSQVSIHSIEYFNACTSNCLDAPFSTKVWARNVLKGYKPGSLIVSIRFPDSSKSASSLEAWRSFFMKAWEDLPHVHFLLLDYSIDWDKKSAIALPNVKVTKMLGYNFLEEFALVQLSDMYVGPYDEYAIAVIGTSKPFMLLGLSETDLSKMDDGTNCRTRQLSRGPHQHWLLDTPQPADLYIKFKQLYMDVRTSSQMCSFLHGVGDPLVGDG